MADDLHGPAQLLLDPFLACPRVPLIGPDMLQTRKLLCGTLQNKRHCGAILGVGGVYRRTQHEPQHIDQEMTFPPRELFRPTVAANASDARRFD